MIRYAFVCPIILFVVLLSHLKGVQRWIQPILAGLVVVIAGAYLKKPYTLEKIAMAVREEFDGTRVDSLFEQLKSSVLLTNVSS